MKREKYDIGLIGLGVMGRNFALNIASKGYAVIGLDRDEKKVKALRAEKAGLPVEGTPDLAELVQYLTLPRKVVLLVPAGEPVDKAIRELLPLLDQGDIVIDGGNSFFVDTDRRLKVLSEKGIRFLGCGLSGGAEGARLGPSIMPGGDREAYECIRPVFEAAAAKAGGEPCVAYLGKGAAGSYVKMVHNGIEYGLMQLISEAYDLLKKGLGLSNPDLQKTFAAWNRHELQSYLIEITAGIFAKKDALAGGYLVDTILDRARQKGTGKWTSQQAMELGIPIPTIDAAVSMRELSAFGQDRLQAEKLYGMALPAEGAHPSVDEIRDALYFGFIVTYAQGMHQLAEASTVHTYDLDLETVVKIWRGGCIIRSKLLEELRKAYEREPTLKNLLLDTGIAGRVKPLIKAVKKVTAFALASGIPAPGMSASLNYFHALGSGRLPVNLIQAQRDCFGSHTYERSDREGIFHTEW